jgi:hypothetical protein
MMSDTNMGHTTRYAMEMEPELEAQWEPVAEGDPATYTSRLRVPGGWVYLVSARSGVRDMAITFVPDPETGD